MKSMEPIHWKTEISVAGKRALELKRIGPANGGLVVEVEEESGKSWRLEFESVQAWKVTSEECAESIISVLPLEGAMFVIERSDWLRQLGDATPLQKSQHFLICCYDEVVEVLAWDCSVIAAEIAMPVR
jgi:hypothetical protein